MPPSPRSPAHTSADDAGLCSRVSTGWLVGAISDAVIAQAHALGCAQLYPHASLVTPGLVQHLHAEGFIVRAWGVANDVLMRQVVTLAPMA